MNKNTKLWVLGHKVTYIETLGDYSLLEVTATPGLPGPPPHYHADATELFYIIDGQLAVYCVDKWHTMQAGESLIVPKSTVHTFKNSSTSECRFMTTWAPKGFERFFLDFGVRMEQKNAFEESISEETIKQVMVESGKYRMVMVEA